MNIVLIALDTLRADHLSCYGYHHRTSPNIDAFATGGVLFENYFAPTIPTHPSFTSLFTSMDAYGHQVVNVAGEHELSPRIKTLPELLQAHGYFTAAVDTLGRWFERGYGRYERPKLRFRQEAQESPRPWSTEKRYVERVNDVALPLLAEAARHDKFFFFYHTWDPHTPYWPPKQYRRKFYRGEFKDPSNLSMKSVWAFDGLRPLYQQWFDPEVTDSRYIVAQYDGEINYMDEHLQRFLDELQRLKVWEESLIMISADHGEILDDHVGQFDHQGLYEGDIRVPLIIRFPGGQHAGTRIETLTANVDVAPTVMELLGLRRPRQMEGRSLLPLIRGEAREHYEQLYLGESNWQCKRGVRTREWKFIRALSTAPRHNWHGEGRRELYNLVDDPLEQNNVIHVRPRIARELERRLDEYLADCRRKYGHEDPIRVQETTFGIRHLTQCRKADFASEEPIR